MIDPQRFVRGTTFDEKALREVAVRRLKRDLGEASRASPSARSARSTTRRQTTRPRRTTGCSRSPGGATRRSPTGGGSRSARDMATLLLKKRFFSSPVAFARTIDVYRDTRTRGLDVDFEAGYDEIFGSDADDLEEGKVDQPELQTLEQAKGALPPLSTEDKADLSWLSDWGHRYEGRADSRLQALIDYIEGTLRAGRPVDQRAARHLHRVRRHSRLDPRDPATEGLRERPDRGHRRQHGRR